MKTEDFKTWRGQRTKAEAGKAIGRTQRMMRRYESGDSPIDATVEMACCADVLGVRHISEAMTLKRLIDETAD